MHIGKCHTDSGVQRKRYTQLWAHMQVEGLALAAEELAALGISTSLRALRTEAGAEAEVLVGEWLGRLEGAKHALSEHRCHPRLTCMASLECGTPLAHAGKAVWHDACARWRRL